MTKKKKIMIIVAIALVLLIILSIIIWNVVGASKLNSIFTYKGNIVYDSDGVYSFAIERDSGDRFEIGGTPEAEKIIDLMKDGLKYKSMEVRWDVITYPLTNFSKQYQRAFIRYLVSESKESQNVDIYDIYITLQPNASQIRYFLNNSFEVVIYFEPTKELLDYIYSINLEQPA